MTIETRITALWPKTEATLAAAPEFDYEQSRDQAVTDAVAVLYATYAPTVTPPEADTIEAVLLQQQIAELAVLQLIPAARDLYMQEAKRESADVSEGMSASREVYDKLGALKTLSEELAKSTAGRATLVAGLIRVDVVPVRSIPSLFTVASGSRGL